jgi:cytochrome c
MKAIYSVVPPLLTLFIWNFMQGSPQVNILGPDEKKTYTWNEQVRYSIAVTDQKDGDSKYGEIPAQECLLTITYLPANQRAEFSKVKEQKEPKALSIMKKSTCFGCHAHKTKLAGPSFQEIAQRYQSSEANINNLSQHILNGSTGVWGDQQMPAHPDLNEEQRRQIASYILEIGNHPYRWVYPGLEGAFRIMDKPKDAQDGVYVLTASYTSTSGLEGRHSIILTIR